MMKKLMKKNTERAPMTYLEGAMMLCLMLMLLSGALFVKTTLAWFSEQQTAAGVQIISGTFQVSLMTPNEQQGRQAQTVNMQRYVPNESGAYVANSNAAEEDFWEPGAVFVSNELYVQNTGTLDLEYRLDLVTARQYFTGAAGTTGSPTTEELSLLDAVKFRIIDADEVNSLTDGRLNEIFTPNSAVDQRRSHENDQIVNGSVRTLKAGSTDTTEKSKSRGFVVIGRMDLNASSFLSDRTLARPFTLVVTAQQPGFSWNNFTATVCTEDEHTTWRNNAQPFEDDSHIHWEAEEYGNHGIYCNICGEEIGAKGSIAVASTVVADAHQQLAEAAYNARATETTSIWTRVVDGSREYYCRVCNEKIAHTDRDGNLQPDSNNG